MQPKETTAYVFADQEVPSNVTRAIEIVKIANEEQVKKIIEILDSGAN